jgi:NAD(P)-dependent dehydrogenase (short-subunit alcohol dehydrogenase family)
MKTAEVPLAGQTLLVIGGSSGIGLATARRAHAEGAQVIITARDPERVHRAGLELDARIAAFDATDFDRLGKFFEQLSTPIDHVFLTGPVPPAHSWPSSTSRQRVATSMHISCSRCSSPARPQARYTLAEP